MPLNQPKDTARKLKIMHVVRAPAGGVLRHINDLARIQVAMGHEVGLICDTVANGSLEEERIRQLESILPLSIRRIVIRRGLGIGDLQALWQVRRILNKVQPDVVHGHAAKGGAFARLAGSSVKSHPVRIYSPHGGSLHFSKNTVSGKMYLGLEKYLEHFTDSFIWVSRYEQEAYRRKIGIPKAASALIYNGLGEEDFVPVAPVPHATDILFVGHMRTLKGVDILLNALDLLHREGRRVTATLVGNGEDRAKFEAQTRALHLEKHVVFHDARPVRQAFSQGRIMVIPSRAESFPYIVLETLAAQVPLIASAVGGIPEILGNGAPELVTPNSPLALANALRHALDNPDAVQKQAEMQHSRLKNLFSQKVMGEAVTNLYETCISIRDRV